MWEMKKLFIMAGWKLYATCYIISVGGLGLGLGCWGLRLGLGLGLGLGCSGPGLHKMTVKYFPHPMPEPT